MVNIGNEWDEILAEEFEKEYYLRLRKFLKHEYVTQTIYPDMYDIFNAIKYTSYSDVKAVILGQDPYHEPGQAHGLCFSVRKGTQKPPSLQNIFKELNSDLGTPIPEHGELTEWAENGVLLLNTVLTVRKGQANSHKGIGWEQLTDSIIMHLSQRSDPVVFMLWGANARAKLPLIDTSRHCVLTAAHPSPLSAYNGFFGCKHFSKANAALKSFGKQPINWTIE